MLHNMNSIPYSGDTFEGENCRESCRSGPVRESLFREHCMHAQPMYHGLWYESMKVRFLREIFMLVVLQKFSPLKNSCYAVVPVKHVRGVATICPTVHSSIRTIRGLNVIA